MNSKKMLAAIGMVCSTLVLVCLPVIPHIGFIAIALTHPAGNTLLDLVTLFLIGALIYFAFFGFDIGLTLLII